MASRLRLNLLGFAVILFLAPGAWATETMTAAGSTFIDPMFAKWTEDYSKVDPSIQINYESIGSLQGIDRLLSRSIDFAASDAPLRLTQLDQPSCQTFSFLRPWARS